MLCSRATNSSNSSNNNKTPGSNSPRTARWILTYPGCCGILYTTVCNTTVCNTTVVQHLVVLGWWYISGHHLLLRRRYDDVVICIDRERQEKYEVHMAYYTYMLILRSIRSIIIITFVFDCARFRCSYVTLISHPPPLRTSYIYQVYYTLVCMSEKLR